MPHAASTTSNEQNLNASHPTPEWLFIVGMVRSGSTWIYNAIRETLEHSGCGQVVGYAGEGDALDCVLQESAQETPRLIKFHDPTDIACDMLASGRARAIYSRRDLRDVAASLVRFEQTSLAELVSSGRLGRIIATHDRWTACDNLLCIDYEDAMAAQADTIARMAGFLGLELSGKEARNTAERCGIDNAQQRMRAVRKHDASIQTQAIGNNRTFDRQTLLHANHVTSGGKTGAYLDVFNGQEIDLLDGIYGGWLQSQGFETGSILHFQQTDDALIVPFADGLSLLTPPSLRLMTPYALIEQGDWFEDEIKFVRSWIRPGMRVVDIGANYGCYTLSMARRVGEKGRVWAFEPASRTADFLSRSIEANNLHNIEVLRMALSDRAGEAELGIEENAELNALSHSPDASKRSETVTLQTLDHMMERFGADAIDFIKLDAEGEEVRILDGGEAFFLRHSPLVMFELKHGNEVNEGLISRFASYGYRPYMLIPGLNILAPFDPDGAVDPYRLNLFCCKDERARTMSRDNLLVMHEKEITDELPEGDAWKTWMKDRAYARELLPVWDNMPEKQSSIPGGSQYLRILNAYAVAHTRGSASTRYRHLSTAFIRLVELMDTYSSPPRLLTLARIAAELGQRAVAVQLLNQVVEYIDRKRTFVPEEPFLASSEAAADIPACGHLANWVLAQTLTERERLHAFSSYFTGHKVLPFLDIIQQLEYPDLEMYRRMHLIRSLSETHAA